MYTYQKPVDVNFNMDKVNDLPNANANLLYYSENYDIETNCDWAAAISENGLDEEESVSVLMDKSIGLPVMFVRPSTGEVSPVLVSSSTRNRFTYVKRDENAVPFIDNQGMPVIMYKAEDNIERPFVFKGIDKKIHYVDYDEYVGSIMEIIKERYNLKDLVVGNYGEIYPQVAEIIDRAFPEEGFPNIRRRCWNEFWHRHGGQVARAVPGDSRFYQHGGVPDLPLEYIDGVRNIFSDDFGKDKVSGSGKYSNIKGLASKASGGNYTLDISRLNMDCDIEDLKAFVAEGGNPEEFVDIDGNSAYKDSPAKASSSEGNTVGKVFGLNVNNNKTVNSEKINADVSSRDDVYDISKLREEYISNSDAADLASETGSELAMDHHESVMNSIIDKVAKHENVSKLAARDILINQDLDDLEGNEFEDFWELNASGEEADEITEETNIHANDENGAIVNDTNSDLTSNPSKPLDSDEEEFDIDESVIVTEGIEESIESEIWPDGDLLYNESDAVMILINKTTLLAACEKESAFQLPSIGNAISSKYGYNRETKIPLITIYKSEVREILVSRNQLELYNNGKVDFIRLGEDDGFLHNLSKSNIETEEENVVLENIKLEGSVNDIVNQAVMFTKQSGSHSIFKTKVNLTLPGTLKDGILDKVKEDREEHGDVGVQYMATLIGKLLDNEDRHAANYLDNLVTNYLNDIALLSSGTPYTIENFVTRSKDYIKLKEILTNENAAAVKHINRLMNRDFVDLMSPFNGSVVKYVTPPVSVKDGMDNESLDVVLNDDGELGVSEFTLEFNMHTINLSNSDISISSGQILSDSSNLKGIVESAFKLLPNETNLLTVMSDGTVKRIVKITNAAQSLDLETLYFVTSAF